MPEVEYLRHRKSSADTSLYSCLTTTTNVNTTTDLTGSDIACDGYNSGTFTMQVAANSTGAPKAYLDVKLGTTYAHYATLHTDMTTTANVKSKGVTPLPNTVRFSVGHLTTSINVRVKCRGVFKV